MIRLDLTRKCFLSSVPLALTLSLSLPACGDRTATADLLDRIVELDGHSLGQLETQRSVIPLDSISSLTIERELVLPDSLRVFRMRTPLALAANHEDQLLAVLDHTDRAVHLFGFDGRYRESLTAGIRDANLLRGGASLAFGNGKSIVVANWSRSLLVLLDRESTGRTWATAPLPSGRPQARGGEIVVDSRGRVYHHWFSRSYRIRSGDWPDTLAPIHVLSFQGDQLGACGAINVFPGETFTVALNRLRLSMRADTLWTGRLSDGRLQSFVFEDDNCTETRKVLPPLFFNVQRPRELVVEEEAIIQNKVQSHINAIDVGPRGHFFLSQSVSYPAEEEALFIPRTALTVLRPDGTWRASYDLAGRVADLVSFEADHATTTVAAIVWPEGGDFGRVAVLTLPVGEPKQ